MVRRYTSHEARVHEVRERLRRGREGSTGRVWETKLTQKQRTGDGPMMQTTIVEHGKRLPGQRMDYVSRVVTEKRSGRIIKRIVRHGFGKSLMSRIKGHVARLKQERLKRKPSRSRSPRPKRRRRRTRTYTSHELLLLSLGSDEQSHIQLAKTITKQNKVTKAILDASVQWGQPNARIGTQMNELAIALGELGGSEGPDGRKTLYALMRKDGYSKLNVAQYALARATEIYIATQDVANRPSMRTITKQLITSDAMSDVQFKNTWNSFIGEIPNLKEERLQDVLYDFACVAIDIVMVLATITGCRQVLLQNGAQGVIDVWHWFIREDLAPLYDAITERAGDMFADVRAANKLVAFRDAINTALRKILETLAPATAEDKKLLDVLANAESFTWLGGNGGVNELVKPAVLNVNQIQDYLGRLASNQQAKESKAMMLKNIYEKRLELFMTNPISWCRNGDAIAIEFYNIVGREDDNMRVPFFIAMTQRRYADELEAVSKMLDGAEDSARLRGIGSFISQQMLNFIAPAYAWSMDAVIAMKKAADDTFEKLDERYQVRRLLEVMEDYRTEHLDLVDEAVQGQFSAADFIGGPPAQEDVD